MQIHRPVVEFIDCFLRSELPGSAQQQHQDMSSVVKLGTWGGDGGIAHDITVAPQRLESITIRNGKVIDSVAFSYRDKDKQLHTAGPWGGSGGTDERTITLDASEYVTEVAGAVGPIGDVPHVITALKIVTNRATYGPFGRGDGTPFSIPVLNNGSIVGMFGRAGGYLDAVGFYVHPF
ncbi:hypothetical protein QOZ80_3AG0251410 [Eleusine coracana subsp. coracana]|nr:hypothetical protein QOZ80_3AG0251410 [Eleusine coracana subsp. coracana]